MDEKKQAQLRQFVIGGAVGVLTKSLDAPIERVKLLVQNQGEMLKSGRLTVSYKGPIDCIVRTFRTEGEDDILIVNQGVVARVQT